MITLIRFESELFLRADTFFLHFLSFFGENGLSRGSRIDTTGLDGDHGVTAVLQEVVSIQGNNSGLIRLGNISEDSVNGTDLQEQG